MADANYARSVFNTIKIASKAIRKDNTPQGNIVYTIDFQTKAISGSFTFPLIESEDVSTGGINLEVADFLTAPTPPVT